MSVSPLGSPMAAGAAVAGVRDRDLLIAEVGSQRFISFGGVDIWAIRTLDPPTVEAFYIASAPLLALRGDGETLIAVTAKGAVFGISCGGDLLWQHDTGLETANAAAILADASVVIVDESGRPTMFAAGARS